MSSCPRKLLANGVPAELTAGLTEGPSAAASEESATVGDLGVAILSGLPDEARAVVEPYIGAIVSGMHEAFSLATGSSFLLGIGAVVLASLVLLPLPEQRLPLERLAELRGRAARRGTHSLDAPSCDGAGQLASGRPGNRSAPRTRRAGRYVEMLGCSAPGRSTTLPRLSAGVLATSCAGGAESGRNREWDGARRPSLRTVVDEVASPPTPGRA